LKSMTADCAEEATKLKIRLARIRCRTAIPLFIA
jgi:hypothetical protein